jgi:hypothetical protein
MHDRFVVRAVVLTLAAITLVGLTVMSALALLRREIPEPISQAFTFAAGAVSSLLVRTSSTPDPPGPQ